MGQTIRNLSTKEISDKAIFNNRMVVEIAEKVHVHYRNLRILLSEQDWISFAQGVRDGFDRWVKRGSPTPKEGQHIELCRKSVGINPQDKDSIRINLNRNLYTANEGRIFSEGADFKDPDYIHLKIRDLRIELSNDEFKALAQAVIEAKEKLDA